MKAIPRHTRMALDLWSQRGIPHPSSMGSFIRAVLQHELLAAAMFADEENREALAAVAIYISNDVPSPAHGPATKSLEAWHERGGLLGEEELQRRRDAEALGLLAVRTGGAAA